MAAWIISPKANNTVPTGNVAVSAGYDTTHAVVADQGPAAVAAPSGTTYDLTIGMTGPNSYAASQPFPNVPTGSGSRTANFTVTAPGDYTVYCDLTKITNGVKSGYGHDSQSPIHVKLPTPPPVPTAGGPSPPKG